MKRLLVLFVVLFTVLFTYTAIAQEMGALKKGVEISFPEKIQKLVLDPLPAGTYTIGSGGYFATIQNAFDKLSSDGIAGEVILELTDNLYTAPTNEFGFSLNGPIPGAGPNSRVTIKPAVNKNVTIEGNNEVLLFLINTSYVTFDGVGLTGTTTLIIHTILNNAYDYNDGIDFASNSDNNVIQNIVFINEAGVKPSGSGFVSDNPAASSPDGNLIQNNFVKQSGAGLYAYGNEAHIANGNIFRGNIIGTETDSLIAFGIIVHHSQNTIIENNIIQNLRLANVWDAINVGIYSLYDSGDIIRNNIVHNIKSSSGYSSVGILLSGEVGYVGSNNSVYNNMVYDIQSTSTQSDSRVTGIQMLYQNHPKIYYNSVYLSGIGANHQGSAALFINNNCTNVDAKDNILVNIRDESPYCASAIYDYSASNLTSDYNDLFYQTNQYNCLVRIGSADYLSLADWQATGQDLNTITEMPFFIQPYLHIDNSIETNLESHGVPVTEVEYDFDGQIRDETTPDIGADEFEGEIPKIWQTQFCSMPTNTWIPKFCPVSENVCWAIGYSLNNPFVGSYLKTTNGGLNWSYNAIPGTESLRSDWIYARDVNTAYVATGRWGISPQKGIYKTTDGGLSWEKHSTAYLNSFWEICYIHFFNESDGVAIGQPQTNGGSYYEIYTTSNDGIDWNRVPDTNIPAANPHAYVSYPGMSAYGNSIWVPTVTNSPNLGNPRIFKSTDKGYTWTVTEISLPNSLTKQYWLGLAFESETTGILTTAYSGSTEAIILKTTDGGETWFDIAKPLYLIVANSSCTIPGVPGGYVVAGGINDGTAYTVDGGNTWTLIDGRPNYNQTFFSSDVGWSLEYPEDRICKYIGSPLITAVGEETEDFIPEEFVLLQNYPNPFNPTTVISYQLPVSGDVSLKVFDILGNEIATLMDEEKTVGTYELTWNAVNLPSGVYFYQLKAGSFIETKKMLLLK